MSYDIYDRVNNTGNGGYSGKSTGDKRANWAIGLAIAGLFCCGGIFSIAAIILGALALGDAYCRNRGRAIAAIIIGIFEVIFWVVLSASIAVSIGNTDTELSDNLVHDDPTAIIEIEETEKPVETGAVEDDEVETGEAEEAVSLGKKNALRSAESYLDVMAFSRSGLINQLEYEGYTTEEAEYAVANCGADWKEQAVRKAESYLDIMSFSRSGLIDQLEYEGYTTEEAEYAVDKIGL